MKKKQVRKPRKAIVMVLTLLFTLGFLGGCATDKPGMVNPSTNLMDGVQVKAELSSQDITSWMENQNMQQSVNTFGVSMFKQSIGDAGGENLLVSPISVLYAMSMCANGANGITRCEMLDALINGFSNGEVKCGTRETPGEGDIFDEWQERLNGYLGSYLAAIEGYEGDPERPSDLHIANSIWVKNDDKLHVEKDFLETNGRYYNAGLYKSNFDENARKEINKWIEDNTNGLIKDMLEDMDENAIMYLINALGFEAEWLSPYEDYQVEDETFHGENGDTQVPFMHSGEWGYLKDDLATGFIKPYAGWDYAFVGLLPNEGVSVDEYIESLTGEGIYKMLTDYSQEDVIVSIPQFENESAMSLVETFKKMGVSDAFDIDAADFTKLGTYEDRNIRIGDILHNTYIKVDQNGTKAGAATVVEMVAEGAFFEPEPPKEVHLDRPFIYMIIDANQHIPLFIGVERNI